MRNENNQIIVKAKSENRYGWNGYYVSYNLFEHGYYPSESWIKEEDFKARFVDGDQYSIKYVENIYDSVL